MRRHWRYHHGTVSWIGCPSSVLRQWFCKKPDRTRGLLRPPLRHAPYGTGEGGPRELPESYETLATLVTSDARACHGHPGWGAGLCADSVVRDLSNCAGYKNSSVLVGGVQR